MKTSSALGLAAAILVAAAAHGATLPHMGVDFAFAQKNKCQGVSPRIQLSQVPANAASYKIQMTDLNVPSFHHWSQTLSAKGTTIPEGAGQGYFGPCPPSGKHRYRIEVSALDADGKPVAYGSKTVEAGQ